MLFLASAGIASRSLKAGLFPRFPMMRGGDAEEGWILALTEPTAVPGNISDLPASFRGNCDLGFPSIPDLLSSRIQSLQITISTLQCGWCFFTQCAWSQRSF